MKENFIITVTNNIESCPIEKYLDSICANVVPIALKRYHRSVVSGTIIALRAVPPVSL